MSVWLMDFFCFQHKDVKWSEIRIEWLLKQWNLRPVPPTTFFPEALALLSVPTPEEYSAFHILWLVWDYLRHMLILFQANTSKYYKFALGEWKWAEPVALIKWPHSSQLSHIRKKGQPLQRGPDSLVHEWNSLGERSSKICWVMPTNAFSRSQWPWSLTADL